MNKWAKGFLATGYSVSFVLAVASVFLGGSRPIADGGILVLIVTMAIEIILLDFRVKKLSAKKETKKEG